MAYAIKHARDEHTRILCVVHVGSPHRAAPVPEVAFEIVATIVVCFFFCVYARDEDLDARGRCCCCVLMLPC